MKVQLSLSDNATPAVKALLEDATHVERIHARMGMAVELLVVRHIRTVMVPRPNQLGAPSTGFWQRAINSVVGKSTMLDAEVSISERGVALQYYGGKVVPKNKRALTIPIAAAAHGKWVGDFPKGSIFRLPGTSILARKVGEAADAKIEPLFVLRRSVTIKPHPEVLPTEQEIAEAGHAAALKYLNRIAA